MKTFVTSRGVEVGFRSVPKELMMRFNSANPQPQPPTYSVSSKITGTSEELPIDEKSIRETPQQFTAEQHAAWNAYVNAQADFIMRFMRFFCVRGLEIHATMDDWLEEQAFLNIPVPENKAERRFEWIVNNVLATEDDYEAMVLGVIEASGVPSDLLTQVEESFRGEVSGNTAEQTGNAKQSVDGQPELRGSESDVALAHNVERVGKPKRARPRVGDSNSTNNGPNDRS